MTEIENYIRSWREAKPRITHGTIQEWQIFTQADVKNPNEPGAVMQHVKKFSRAILQGKASSEKTSHQAEQEIFYVVNGEGSVITDKKEEKVYEGSAILVPANVPHIISNRAESQMELLIITEDISENTDSSDREDILVRNYHDLPINKMDNGELFHWCHKPRVLFTPEDNLSKLHYVLFVSIDARKVAEPHKHPVGTDEVFYQLGGESFMILGNGGALQKPGTAIMIPPDNRTEHASVTFDEPASWFYFAHHAKLKK